MRTPVFSWKFGAKTSVRQGGRLVLGLLFGLLLAFLFALLALLTAGGLELAELHGARVEFGAREFVEDADRRAVFKALRDVGAVRFDRSRRKKELFGDLAVLQALTDQIVLINSYLCHRI